MKDLILEFLRGGSFFSEKKIKLLDYYAIIMFFSPLGGCVNEVVDSQANCQDADMMFISFSVIHLQSYIR